jgi:hypothetical protein
MATVTPSCDAELAEALTGCLTAQHVLDVLQEAPDGWCAAASTLALPFVTPQEFASLPDGAVVRAMQRFRALRVLSLGPAAEYVGLDALASAAAAWHGLLELALRRSSLGNLSRWPFDELLAALPRLQRLDLYECVLFDGGAITLGRALAAARPPELSYLNVTDTMVMDVGAVELAGELTALA